MLDIDDCAPKWLAHQSAAELRSLHAVNAELLEALKGMLIQIGEGREAGVEWVCEPIHSDEIRAARAAIAKAEESNVQP